MSNLRFAAAINRRAKGNLVPTGTWRSGTGSVNANLGYLSEARLQLGVIDVTNADTLNVKLQDSYDASTWYDVDAFSEETVAEGPKQVKTFDGPFLPHTRIAWTVEASTAGGYDFTVDGVALS